MKVDDDYAENYQKRNQMQKMWRCGSCAVDGGLDYLRRCGNLGDWEELSEVEKVEGNNALT